MTAEHTALDHAVIGASDPDATAALLLALDFEVVADRMLPTAVADALYGLPATRELLLTAGGRDAGAVRVVAAPAGTEPRDPYRRGGHALDLYTRDLAASCAAAGRAGARVGPLADYVFGPVHLRQAQGDGPDDVPIVFVELEQRLPSLLDDDPDRLHSELHSTVWSVDDLDTAIAYWRDAIGLQLRSTFPIADPAVPAFMGLPRPSTLRMAVLTGPDAAAPRMELLAYDDEPGPAVPLLPLRAGATVPVVSSDDFDGVRARAVEAGARPGPTVEGPGRPGEVVRACVLVGPGELGCELRERPAVAPG